MKKKKKKTEGEIEIQIADLKVRLSEAVETLAAIRRGEVDGLVVSTPKGEQLVTLGGAEQSYQGMFETLKGHVPEDVQGLIHQLKAHHEELETQNEELHRMQMEIEESRRIYSDLYNFAPVGYFLIDRMGVVHSANLTGAKMVGWNQHDMLGLPFTVFILQEDIGLFLDHMRNVFSNHSKQTELRILGDKRKSVVQVQLQSVIAEGIQGGPTFCRTALIDISERKRAEEALRESENRLRLLSSQLLVTQEKERKLAAQEIHDSIGSSLAATKFRMEEVFAKVGENRPQTRGALEGILPVLQQAIQETRRIQLSLRPSMLDDLGILPTINWFCRQFETTYSHIHISQEINIEESEVPDFLKTVIYRVLQEAMNNIAKHSKAGRINLLLRKMDGAIELGIQDNGEGFNPEEAYSRNGTGKGLGLDSMRERTELSGGSFSIESSKGAGTVIQATWLVNS